MTQSIYQAYDLPDYRGSKDYSRLAELAKRQSVICIVDYRIPGLESRDVARTQYMSKGAREYWTVGARGTSYLTAFSQDEFEALCTHLNLEFIEPASAVRPSEDSGCICKGNWQSIIKETELSREIDDRVEAAFFQRIQASSFDTVWAEGDDNLFTE